MPARPVRDAEVTFLAGAANLPTMNAVLNLVVADGTVRLPTAASTDPIGVAQADAVASKAVTVLQEGIARCIASAAIAIGDYVEIADATGKVRTKAKAGAGVQPTPIVGRALTAAAASGDFLDVMLMVGGMY
jgi:hypothetical protein